MLQLAERCYWKIQINQYNGRRCNCRHRPVCQLVSLMGKWAFFNDLSEPECVTMPSRGEDKTKAFSFFAHQLFYWILLIFRVGGWEVSALWRKSHQVACVEQVFMNQFLFFNSSSSSPHILPFWPDEEQRHWVQAAGAEAAWLREDPATNLRVWGGRAVVAPWALPPFIPLPESQEMCRRWNCCTNWTLQWLVQIPWWPKILFLCMASALENTEQLDSCR